MQIPLDKSSRESRFYMNISARERQALKYSNYLTLNELSDAEQTLRKKHYSESEKDFCLYAQCEELAIPSQPPDNWNFRLFLIKLSKEVTHEDLEIVKFLITGNLLQFLFLIHSLKKVHTQSATYFA